MDDQVPLNWARCTIHDLTGKDGLFADGDWVETKDQDPNGGVRLIQLADVGEGVFKNKSNRYLTSEKADELNCTFLERGDVLISRLPDPLGKCCIFPLDGDKSYISAVDVSILRLHSEIDPRWFVYFFNSPSVREQVYRYKTGSTRPRISRKNVGKVTLPCPPKAEQRRIVAKIEELFSELDNGVESLKTARAQLQTYRQSLLKAAFEGRLTEQWRRDNADEFESGNRLLQRIREEREEHYQNKLAAWESSVEVWEANGKSGKKPKKPSPQKIHAIDSGQELRPLPQEWSWISIGELTEGVKNGLYKPSSEYGAGSEIIRIDDFYDGFIRVEGQFKQVRVSTAESSDYALKAGDLLVNRVNSIEYLGKVGLVRSRHEGMLFESNIMRLRFLSQSVDPSLYARYLSTAEGISSITRNAKHAVNQASVNQTDVLSTPVPLVPPEEAKVLLDYLDTRLSEITHLEAVIDDAINRTLLTRQSILKRAFEGKLVPQNPNDEPASALLERIRQEQGDQSIQKRGNRKTGATA